MSSFTFVIGDIHGRDKALNECLDKVGFDGWKDRLIVLGDICDGGYNTYEVVETLLELKKVVFIMGNHDIWFLDHNGAQDDDMSKMHWLQSGGEATVLSYKNSKFKGKIPEWHLKFFNTAKPYHIENGDIFIHGGFDPFKSLREQTLQTFTWDRDLINIAKKHPIPMNDIPTNKLVVMNDVWNRVFIGHTTTQTQGANPEVENITKPIKYNNLWMMDTGAGWNGRLTIMDIETEEFKQSKKQSHTED